MDKNPLGSQPIGKLLLKFAIPTIISLLVNAIYNITDQVFIGHSIGYLGNAATNIAFPLSNLCDATAILLGLGSASNFNLRLGEGKKEEAALFAGTGISLMVIFGIFFGVVTFIFVRPMINAFGATEHIFDYALTYTRIIAIGMPFVIFSSGCSSLIRSDGSPTYSMISIASGAIINIILDPIFIFIFGWGIAGAAYATIISQFVTFILAINYIRRFKSIKLTRKCLKIKLNCIEWIAKLGIPGFLNHFMMMLVQITKNNMLRAYGKSSIYGTDIPIAVVGIIMKINIIIIAFIIGTTQGCQPIFGYNYGAKNYARVKETYKLAAITVSVISIVAFACLQLFPRQIISIFGSGTELYFEFAVRYMRIFMMLVCLFGIQPLAISFFTSIGKAYKGLFVSVTRQGLFLIPLLFILPGFFGLDGIIYAGPISDGAAILFTVIVTARELRNITRLEKVKV